MAAACTYCGTEHDRAEDAACGCGCGSEPLGCAGCMREGGPSRRFDGAGRPLGERYPMASCRDEFDPRADDWDWDRD